MIKELDRVVLTIDLPAAGLYRSATGTVVHVYANGELLEVEFINELGNTVDVVTIQPEHVILYE